jgi:hypothetical protein
MAVHKYTVNARLKAPNFEVERRYALMEKQLAHREMEKLPARSWMWFSYPAVGLLRREDWRKYIHELEKYEHRLDRHQQEIRDGFRPLEFNVVHEGHRPDTDIYVHVMVEAGQIDAHKQAPKRPERIDGAPNKSTRHRFYGFENFVRRGIHIGRHGVEARFSRMESHDNALVVNQPLHVALDEGGLIRFEIRSQEVPDGVTGHVTLD